MLEDKAPAVMQNVRFLALTVLSVCAGLLLSGCAANNENVIIDNGIAIHDPYEETNRNVFSFNKGIDNAIIHPIVRGYRAITPKPARTGLRNADLSGATWIDGERICAEGSIGRCN